MSRDSLRRTRRVSARIAAIAAPALVLCAFAAPYVAH